MGWFRRVWCTARVIERQRGVRVKTKRQKTVYTSREEEEHATTIDTCEEAWEVHAQREPITVPASWRRDSGRRQGALRGRSAFVWVGCGVGYGTGVLARMTLWQSVCTNIHTRTHTINSRTHLSCHGLISPLQCSSVSFKQKFVYIDSMNQV